MSTLSIYIIGWFVLMALAIFNGALRVSTYGKKMPEIRAHQLSCLTGMILIGIAVYFMHFFWPILSGKQALFIGFLWVLITILFEFVFGHYIMKHPWQKLFFDYRLDKGRLWLIVLLWIFFIPLIMYLI